MHAVLNSITVPLPSGLLPDTFAAIMVLLLGLFCICSAAQFQRGDAVPPLLLLVRGAVVAFSRYITLRYHVNWWCFIVFALV